MARVRTILLFGLLSEAQNDYMMVPPGRKLYLNFALGKILSSRSPM
jgi:hypothetical protein